MRAARSPPSKRVLMMNNQPNIHFRSDRDDWPTPMALFATLNAEFGFTLDAAASHENTKVPARYFTIEDDGLKQPWTGTVWCNPPYGKGVIDAWVAKAIQSAREGATVVMLVPARPGSRWFTQLIEHSEEVRLLTGRITFEGAGAPAPFPSAIAVLRPPVAWPSPDKDTTFVIPTRHDYSHPWTTLKVVRRDD